MVNTNKTPDTPTGFTPLAVIPHSWFAIPADPSSKSLAQSFCEGFQGFFRWGGGVLADFYYLCGLAFRVGAESGPLMAFVEYPNCQG